jgi:hypothetical protein
MLSRPLRKHEAPKAPAVRLAFNIQPGTQASTRLHRYSGFDSGLSRILDAKWHFSQENATLHHLQMTTFESKPL